MEEEFYPITSVCKDDIRGAFREDEKDKLRLIFIEKKINELSEDDMKYLAKKMADDYCDCCFWISLKERFKDLFLEGLKNG